MNCIQVFKAAKEGNVTFMRVFILLSLRSVLYPGTDNVVSTRYLYSLVDISQSMSFD